MEMKKREMSDGSEMLEKKREKCIAQISPEKEMGNNCQPRLLSILYLFYGRKLQNLYVKLAALDFSKLRHKADDLKLCRL